MLKHIKHLLLIPVLAVLVGCAGLQTEDDQIRRVSVMAELAAYDGAMIYLDGSPESRPHFERAVASLDSIINIGEFSPVDFRNTLAKLAQDANIKELRGAKGQVIITSAVVMFEEYGRGRIDVDQVKYLAPVVKAVRNGLAAALRDTGN